MRQFEISDVRGYNPPRRIRRPPLVGHHVTSRDRLPDWWKTYKFLQGLEVGSAVCVNGWKGAPILELMEVDRHRETVLLRNADGELFEVDALRLIPAPTDQITTGGEHSRSEPDWDAARRDFRRLRKQWDAERKASERAAVKSRAEARERREAANRARWQAAAEAHRNRKDEPPPKPSMLLVDEMFAPARAIAWAGPIARQACASGDARQLRESVGVTVDEVAERLRTSPGVITLWESGTGNPSVAYAALLIEWQSLIPQDPDCDGLPDATP